MMNGFTFNGTSTQSLGLLVTALNPYNSATRKVDKFTIPYRNGDLIIDSGTYDNIRVGYEISVIRNTKATCDAINEWLSGSQGYCILSDTYNPEIFRVGYMADSIEYVLTALYREGKATIEFDCLPQKYLVSNRAITFSPTSVTTENTAMSLSTVPVPLDITLKGNTTQEGSSGENLFDSGFFLNAGWTLTNGYYTGTPLALKNYSDSVGGVFPNGLNASRITISFDGYKEGTRTNTVRVYIGYSDSTNTWIGVTSTEVQHYTITSTSGKTVTNVTFSYGTSNTTYLKNFQIELGATETAYEPHISPTNPQDIKSVKGDNTINVTGFNLWDEQWESGTISAEGTNVNDNTRIRSTNYIPIAPETTYYAKTGTTSFGIRFYGLNKVFLGSSTNTVKTNTTFTSPANAYFMRFSAVNTTSYNYDFCINVSSSKNGTYEPYTRQSYPIYLPVENLNKIADVKSGWLPTSGAYPTTNGSYPNAQYLIVPLNKGETCYLSGTTNIKGRVRAMNTSTVIGTVTANTTYYTTTADQSSGFKEGSITALQDLLLGILFMDGYASSGGNELIIAKGTNVQNYSIELNKIGTYQDYIYKNGGKWYVHKETGKVDLGTLTWLKRTYSGAPHPDYFSCTTATFIKEPANTTTPADMRCPIYTSTGASVSMALASNYLMNVYNGTLSIVNETYADARAFKSAMSGVELLYALATPTNTEITDTTLINQLNNIEKAYSYDGNTNISQVSSENGFMLSVTSLSGASFVSNYRGEPVITVNGTGLISFNGIAIKVNQAPVTLNSQTLQCYNGTVNMNNYVEMDDFPMIKKGDNTIGSSMALTVVPNYWKL